MTQTPATPARPVYRYEREPVQLRSNTILPALREDIELHTEDGLTLVGELALPAEGQPRATLVTLHPLPTHGGFMDSHVYRKAAWRLPSLAGLAVLRFNTRGTCSPRGCSEGQFEEGDGERADVLAAMDFVRERGLPNPWLVGWSFGTELTLKYGTLPAVAEQIRGAVLLSPPLHRAGDADLATWEASGLPLTALVPEFDDYLRPAEAAERFGAHAPGAAVVGIDGAKHLWVGEKYVRRAHQEIVDAVLGDDAVQLPGQVTGPVATAAA
ncbi:alpha/beta hydrolase [Galactobacter caseinivorans]|uniref:Alpha/beta hydrolase n=1 Tax=Galactobacter caseinivorans TaxID=2676123 RepID=A0A496PN27_9MICC|nr:alpha/beta hydrolase [Galactobacter caseinivorans]RKW71866.1 alpha/beta hydrolase [Galactobacter caseinivorans]